MFRLSEPKIKTSVFRMGVIVIFIGFILLSVLALKAYPGRSLVYLGFTAVFNLLLVLGFRKGRIFLDTFIGIFFWMGFWLKLTLRLVFYNGTVNEMVGHFPFTPEAWDKALIVSMIGACGFGAASLIREKYFFTYTSLGAQGGLQELRRIYEKYRRPILILYVFLFCVVNWTNFEFGIYQRGSTPRTILPLGLNGIYSWLMLFGFSSFFCLFLDFESKSKKNVFLIIILGLFEAFLTSVSLLSRGMILNLAAIGYGAKTSGLKVGFQHRIRVRYLALGAVASLIAVSVLSVNLYRSLYFFDEQHSQGQILNPINQKANSLTKSLFVDRFVGIEGVMTVSGYDGLGWPLLKTAWSEKFKNSGTSFYDRELMLSPYASAELGSKHFITLPGIIAFLYYPGSEVFLFIFIFILLVALGASAIERMIYFFGGGNLLLCALMAQVLAYRFSNFGYVPSQSYLLILSVIGNAIIFYLCNKIARHLV